MLWRCSEVIKNQKIEKLKLQLVEFGEPS